MAFYQHLVARAIFKGIDKFNAAFLVTILGICSVTSRFVSGFIANLPNVNRIIQFAFGGLLGGIAAILSFPAQTFWEFTIVVVTYGSTVGRF